MRLRNEKMGLFKKNNIVIVGEIHGMDDCEEFKKELIKKANYKEIVLGLEGCVRDENMEQRLCKDVFDLDDKGHIYGYEDSMTFTYARLMIEYLVFTPEYGDIPDILMPILMMQRINMKSEFIGQLCINEHLRKHWGKIGPSLKDKESKDIYDIVDDYVFNKDYDNLHHHSLEFAKENYKLSDNVWLNILQKLLWSFKGDVMNYMNDDEQHNLDGFLTDPHNPYFQTFAGFYININWRGRYMYQNMRDIAQIAKAEDKDAYFIMGALHVKDISKRFGYWAMGFNKRVYPHPALVDPKYVP